MAKVEVSKELAETLKELRLQYKVQAKSVAAALGKSNAYITKLEKGGIQTITREELAIIYDVIAEKADNPESVEDRIVRLLNVRYSEEEIKEQIWLYNFDTTFRQIPVPEELIDEINIMIEENQINRVYLFDRINSNEGLTQEDRSNDNIPYNEWYKTDVSFGIKLKIDWNIFNDLLDKKIDKSIYMYPYSILTYLYLIISENKQNETTSFAYCENLAIKTMNKFKFYSLRERVLLYGNNTEKENNNILTSFDKDNVEIINRILNGFHFITEVDIKIANERLTDFANNLDYNIGFMLKLISLDYKKLESTSFEQKKSFLNDVEKLIEKYSNKSKDNTDITLY